MPTCSNNIVKPQILNFQARYANILHHHRLRAVRPSQSKEQERMLAEIWQAGRLGVDDHGPVERLKGGHGNKRTSAGWRKIGLYVDGEEGEAPFLMEADLFRDVGDLGLECLVGEKMAPST